MCGVLDVPECLEGTGGLLEIVVDVGGGLLDVGVVSEEGAEGVPGAGGEEGLIAELGHGVDELGVALELVGMDLAGLRQGDVLVPLVAEAAVARVSINGLL